MFYIRNRITNDSHSRSKYLRDLLVKTNTFNYVPIKYKQMSFMSNGGKFKLYTVSNDLLSSTPTQPRFSFERSISSQYLYCTISRLLLLVIQIPLTLKYFIFSYLRRHKWHHFINSFRTVVGFIPASYTGCLS
jgi:hypothetical protein